VLVFAVLMALYGIELAGEGLLALLGEALGWQLVAGASWIFTALALCHQGHHHVRDRGRRKAMERTGTTMLALCLVVVPVGKAGAGRGPGASEYVPWLAVALVVTLVLVSLVHLVATRVGWHRPRGAPHHPRRPGSPRRPGRPRPSGPDRWRSQASRWS